MDLPIQATLRYFSKICDERNEFPGFDMERVEEFFYKIKKDYPKVFSSMTEETIERELSNFRITGTVQFVGPRYHPHFVSPGMSKAFDRLYNDEFRENQKELEEIAQRFYDEVGCNFKGELGKRTKIFDE